MKTIIIVTNRGKHETEVFRAKAAQGFTVELDGNTFKFDCDKGTVTAAWGDVRVMSRGAAKRRGANLGIWFTS